MMVLKGPHEGGVNRPGAVEQFTPEELHLKLDQKNTQLTARARQMREILKVNEVLSLDLPLEEILERVANAVQHSLGLRRVLISLYDRDHHLFIRKAQAGLSPEEFRRAKEEKIPKEYFFQFFQEKYQMSHSFFIRHGEAVAAGFGLKAEGQTARSDFWHSDDSVLVPLISADRGLLGIMSVDGPGDGQVPDMETIGILELFANQAAQAVLNVMLYERAKARARALETLGTIGKQIGAQLEFDLLLERMVEIIKAHLRCTLCAVLLWDGQRQKWYVGAPKSSAPSLTVEMNKVDHIIQQVAQRGKPVISEQPEAPPGRERFFEGSRFSAFLPLKAQEQLLGVLAIAGHEDMIFGDKDELFWNSLSDQMATAIGNAQLFQNAKHTSITDGLTGLYNHRHFQERLRDEESRSLRHGHPYSVIMLDIDHFKNYNDVCGHPTGDKALAIIAQLIKAQIRDIDIVARYGGEEFVIILTETDKAGAWKVAERIRKKVADHKFPHGQIQPQGRLTVSLGVASFPADADNRKDLVERADEALYVAKKLGRDQVFISGQSETTWPE